MHGRRFGPVHYESERQKDHRTQRCTEWRPRHAAWQIESHRGAAIGELIVRRQHHAAMHDQQLKKCPGCGGPFEVGFSAKASALSFIAASKFRSYAFVDEDLNRRTWLQRVLFSPARYCHSYLCRPCGLYLVDYEAVVTRKEADAEAGSLQPRTAT
jgi:hypothetical protein